MSIIAKDIKPGSVIRLKDGKLWKAMSLQHVKPGKGGAFMIVELEELYNGTKTSNRFRVEESIELLNLEEVKCQLSYKDKDQFVLLRLDNYEQIYIPVSKFAKYQQYMVDDLELGILFDDDKFIDIVFPETVVLTVDSADVVLKRQTASSISKNAIANGMVLSVPAHVEPGMKIVVRTNNGEYVRKA